MLFVALDVKNEGKLLDQPFSMPKCVKHAGISEASYEMLCKTFSSIPTRTSLRGLGTNRNR